MKNRLAALMAKKNKISISADKTRDGKVFDLEIQGLNFKGMTKLAAMAEKNDTEGAINFLLFSTLRKALPKEGEENGISDKELQESIDNLDGSIASEIVRKVMEISGIEASVPKKDLEVVEGAEKKQSEVSSQK